MRERNVAIDLRFVVSVVNIAEHTRAFSGKDPVDTAQRLPKMAEVGHDMLRKSLDAVVNMETALARGVFTGDDIVDSDHHALVAGANNAIRKDGSRVDELVPLMLVSKHIERIADLATNIAEDAIYMVDGEIVRHGRHHVAGDH